MLMASGRACRKKRWWKSGNDHLSAYDKEIVIWTSSEDSLPETMVDRLEAQPWLQAVSAKDRSFQNSEGHEDESWAGTQADLLMILHFNGIIYVTDGSQSVEGMGAGFYWHDTGNGGCCRVSNGDEGESSNRSEHTAASMTLGNSMKENRNIVILIDSKCLLNSIQPWIGEDYNLMIHKFPDGGMLKDIIEFLRKRIERGLFLLFVKIQAQRGEFFNEMADRWANQGIGSV